MAKRLAALKRRAKQHGLPAVYVNDNFGRWRSYIASLVDRCLHDNVLGRPVAELLRPEQDDYFVLKPTHSGFYSTPLALLLEYLGSRLLILTGLTGDFCVRLTANYAYMRDFLLSVPADCVASRSRERNDLALKEMEQLLDADITESSEIDFKILMERAREN
jgi:nicotinamidase-related amidase